ncbi:MAG TPA: hypothetical protein VIL36_13125 [Acidimicrobiales bacterium]
MEVLIEVAAEVLFGFGMVAVAYAVGSIVYLQVRAARRGLRHLGGAEPVVDPQGGAWTVGVALAPPPLRLALSRRWFRMRPSDQAARARAGVAPDGVTKEEAAHPSHLVERFEELSGVVVWVVLLVTLVAVVVLLLEVLLVAVVAALVLVVRTLLGRWQCEVVGPDGRRWHVPAGSLGDARTVRDELRAQLAAGITPSALAAADLAAGRHASAG